MSESSNVCVPAIDPKMLRGDMRPVRSSWSRQYALRRGIAARFGKIFAVPLVKRCRDVLLSHAAPDTRVLEIGAGDRRLKSELTGRHPGLRYESMDIDPCGEHDYTSLDDVTDRYELIFAFELVEHLTLDELRAWFEEVAALLQPGGRLLVTTPNIYYPPNFLRDVTHRTPLCFDELGAMVECVGLKTEHIYRVYHDPIHRMLLRRYLFGWVFRMIGIDFARQIMLVAQKPAVNGTGTGEQPAFP